MDAHIQDLFTRFTDHFTSPPSLGPTSSTSLLKIPTIPPAFIKSLFRSSAALFRTDPWKRLRPSHLLGVRVGKDFDWANKKQPFPCAQFIGHDGGDLGFHMFKSDLDSHKPLSPETELLRVIFMPESLLLPSAKKMIKLLSLETAAGDRFPVIDVARGGTAGGIRFRNPTAEELRFVFAFMNAAALVLPFLRCADDGRRGRLMKFENFIETVDVQWPTELPRAGELVAVTISHPPGRDYSGMKMNLRNSTQVVDCEEVVVVRSDS